ncbi:hypothetical protein D918_09285 [Trichuris suis]|nr:hypothetical protein D918_09285 [Trichuris suis]
MAHWIVWAELWLRTTVIPDWPSLNKCPTDDRLKKVTKQHCSEDGVKTADPCTKVIGGFDRHGTMRRSFVPPSVAKTRLEHTVQPACYGVVKVGQFVQIALYRIFKSISKVPSGRSIGTVVM